MINPITTNGSIIKAIVYGNSLFVAGQFNLINGQPRTNFAEIDLTTGNLTSFGPSFSSYVYNMVQFQDKLMILGGFSSAAGVATPHAIIQLNLTTRTFSNPLSSVVVAPYGSPGSIGVVDFKFLPNTNTMIFAGTSTFTQGLNTRYGMFGLDANTMLMNNIAADNVLYDYVTSIDVDPTNDILYYVRWNYVGAPNRQRVGSYNVSNPNLPTAYTWVLTINPMTDYVNNITFVDNKIFVNALIVGRYSILVKNAATGANDPQDWNVYNNLFPGISKINKVLVRNNNAYVFGFFTHVTASQSLRNAMYVRDKTTGIFSGDNINFSFPRVVQPSSPVYTLLYIVNEIKDAIFHEDKLYVFGGNLGMDGIINLDPINSPSSLEFNIDGTRIQKRIALLL